MTLALATAIAAALYFMNRWDQGVHMSPDGRFYYTAGGGRPVPTPYRLRWLWPMVIRQQAHLWEVLSAVSLIAWGPLMALYLAARGFPESAQLAGVVLLCGLPGLFRLTARFPILVDGPAFALALASATCFVNGQMLAGIVLSLLAGASKESAPIFAAAFCLDPLALVGLLAAGWWRKAGMIPDWARDWLTHPIAAARKAQAGAWLDWTVVVLPWGAVAAFAAVAEWRGAFGLAAAIALVAGYAGMGMAQDRARVYCWAAPAVIALALTAIPPDWAVPVCAVHLMNPYRGL